MVIVVADGLVRGQLELVAGVRLDDVRQNIGSVKVEVFDDQVNSFVAVLDTGNRDVVDLAEKLWEDNGANILPQMRLVGEFAFAIKCQLLGEALDILAELDVEWVVGVCRDDQVNRCRNTCISKTYKP